MPITLTTSLASSGTATFKVYSLHGHGSAGPSPFGGQEIADGDLIEMVAPGTLSLYYDNVSGLSESDLRKLTFTTDYGERYDAQFLTHSYLPTGFTTRADSGAPTLGLVPGYISGHVHLGTDMSGNQVLNKDYTGGPGPTGTMDLTVTCTVSDGSNSGSIEFTVRLVDPVRWYTDKTKSTYGLSANQNTTVDVGNRRGVIYCSRTDDFTGAPTGPDIYHMHIADGNLADGIFTSNTFWVSSKTIYDSNEAGYDPTNPSGTGTNIGNFSWSTSSNSSYAVFLKGGETYFAIGDNMFKFAGELNSLLGSWGTGRATLDCTGYADSWSSGNVVFTLNDTGFLGNRFWNIDFYCSDYDNSDVTWREWWNILKYASKTGTISENTNIDFNGTVLTNGSGVYTQVIQDDGVDTLLVRQIVDSSDVNDGSANDATFSAGDVLEDVSNAANTVTLTATTIGWRQDRTRRVPPTLFRMPSNPDGMAMAGCIIRGPAFGINGWSTWGLISDTLIRDYWNYAMSGGAFMEVHNGVVMVQPSSHQGDVSDFGVIVADKRNNLNQVRQDTPNVPVDNNIRHSCTRMTDITGFAQYKCGSHSYGGHGSIPQPAHRTWTNANTSEDGHTYVYQHGCFYSGGARPFQIYAFGPPFTPKAWVLEDCWFRGDFCTQEATPILIQPSNTAIKGCRIGWPSGVTIDNGDRGTLSFVSFGPDNETVAGRDDSAVTPFVEDCLFEYLANTSHTTLGNNDTTLRAITDIPYSGSTYDIDYTKFTNVGSEYP